MIFVFNIVSPTKDSEILWQQVALNTFPMVWFTDSEDISDLYSNEDLINALKEIVKTNNIYTKAEVHYRQFNDDMEMIKKDKFKLSDNIEIKF